MKKIVQIIIIGVLAVSFFTGCKSEETGEDKLQVAVSIVPEEAFVKAVAGDLVNVVTLIPSGASPTNYQPTPMEMTEFSNSSVYFSIGVAAEEANILPNIVDLNSEIKVVALAEVVDNVYEPVYFVDEDEDEDEHEDEHDVAEDGTEAVEDEHEHEGRDPHSWMSPKRVIVMVETIRDELILLDGENEEIYRENAASYIEELEAVDQEIQETMDKLENKTFIIMHPSMGYFAKDYGLTMVALEDDGKEATAARLQEVIDFALEENIQVIFYQEEFDSSQAETLAMEIDGETMALAPLSFDYIDNLYEINETFKGVLK
jgi:zinc transport system substrate-binding protein